MVYEGKSHEDRVLRFTTDIVSAYLRNNKVKQADISGLVDVVHNKINTLYSSSANAALGLVPAVPIADSISNDHIICLEDGKKFKMLKKHLRTQYNLSPEEYRAKWNLPPDYPMVAPSYAEKRQALAKASGLGKNR